jgi:hypothetical protein
MFGLTRLKTIAVAATLVAAAWVGAASATTVEATCGDDSRNYWLSSEDDTLVSITCYAVGEEISIFDEDLHQSLIEDGYEFASYIGQHVVIGDVSAFFSGLFELLGGVGGTFDVNQAVDAVLIFEMAPRLCGAQTLCDPVYGAFEISVTGATILEWAFTPHEQRGRGLNHVSVWLKPAEVPLPAAGLLLLGGLGALGVAKRRRKAA